MAKRVELADLNCYYGDFHAVDSVNLTIEPKSVTAFIGPSGCGKSTVLRSINRMHEVTPGAKTKGKVLLDDEDIYGSSVDPVTVRRTIGMVFQRPNPFPTMSGLRQRRFGLEAGRDQEALCTRRLGREFTQGRGSVGRGQRSAEEARRRTVRWSAAAPVHRPGHCRPAAGAAHGRALLGPRPDQHADDRRPDWQAQGRVHDHHRHPQHAAGRPA